MVCISSRFFLGPEGTLAVGVGRASAVRRVCPSTVEMGREWRESRVQPGLGGCPGRSFLPSSSSPGSRVAINVCVGRMVALEGRPYCPVTDISPSVNWDRTGPSDSRTHGIPHETNWLRAPLAGAQWPEPRTPSKNHEDPVGPGARLQGHPDPLLADRGHSSDESHCPAPIPLFFLVLHCHCYSLQLKFSLNVELFFSLYKTKVLNSCQ